MEETREALFFLTKYKAHSVKMKDEMVAAHNQKKAVGDKINQSSETMMSYLDAIFKIRAYDLLWLE